MLHIDPHPLLHLAAFTARFETALGEIAELEWLTALLAGNAHSPLTRDETVRATTRDLLRHGGYKPTGRGKPASEYLVRAASENKLRSINVAVDACNVVSLHSGLPISVVDLELATDPLRVGIAAAGSRFVFNVSGQEIDVGRLLCLHDADGPCANAVKDSQRTKTRPETTQTLQIIWGHTDLAQHVNAAAAYYVELLTRAGCSTTLISTERG